jgi:N4-gp56 family major capsid protein
MTTPNYRDANMVNRVTTNKDQEKFLAAKLLQRAHLKLVAASLCDKITQPKGSGLQAHFIRYKRMSLPMAPLAEGVPPLNNQIAVEEVTGTMDQWGDVLTITDVAELTTKHPLMKIAQELLSDNAQRVIDREVQLVMMAGTNVTYGDGIVTTRKAITTAMTIDDRGIIGRRIQLGNAGVPPREGPGNMDENARGKPASGSLLGGAKYVAVTGLEVSGDIQARAASAGLWVDIARYQNATPVYTGEVGTYLNFRWVETNFMPRLRRLGAVTAGALASGNALGANTPVVTAVDGGGTLTSATAHFFKVTRKDLSRGFEEEISEERSMTSTATGNNESFTFNFSGLASGYVYNVYMGVATGDANLRLVGENVAVDTTLTVGTIPGSAPTPPAGLNTTGPVSAVYPIYMLGAEALSWTGLQELKTYITGGEAVKGFDPLGQLRQLGYKFMGKTLIKDQTRLLRWEVASTF